MSTAHDGFEDRVVELGAGRIHLHEAGEGEPLVFVHGFGVSSSLWAETARRLTGAHRVILPELPFGSHPEALSPEADLSPPGAARLLSELLAALELEGATLIGNDSGGAISQITVTEHPERIGRLVLTNCDCFEVFPPGRFKALVAALKVPGMARLIAESMRFDANRRSPLAYGALSNRRIPDELLISWTRPQLDDAGIRRDSRKFGSGMASRHTLAAAEKLPELDIPVLLAWGEQDRFFKIELAERLAAVIRDSRLVRFAESRTFVPIDEPEALATAIEHFIRETEAAPSAAA